MSKLTDQYVYGGYWEYGYAEYDVEPTNGSTTLFAIATLLANGNAIFALKAALSCLSYLIAVGFIIGEEWTDEQAGTNTWIDKNSDQNIWTDKTIGTNTWQLAE
jgi:hypothetical protein